MLSTTSSDDSNDDELELLNIIDANNNQYLYCRLLDVMQEHYLTLRQAPGGIMSRDFSTCFAIIMKDKKTNHAGLAHVSSIADEDLEFFKTMMLDITEVESDVEITLARSQQAYTDQYQQELEESGYKWEQTAEEYFAEHDLLYRNFFETHFPACRIKSTILEMPHSCIVVSADGTIDCLEQHTISSIRLEQVIPPSPKHYASNPHILMPTSSGNTGADDDSKNEHPRKHQRVK